MRLRWHAYEENTFQIENCRSFSIYRTSHQCMHHITGRYTLLHPYFWGFPEPHPHGADNTS